MNKPTIILKALICSGLAFSLLLIAAKGMVFKETPIPALGNLLNPFSGYLANGQDDFPPEESNFDGLKEGVKIHLDERLVPHIFANSYEDALFAQGYITAYYRLWQMEFSSRAALGELSEVLGKRTLVYDKNKRKKGMQWLAENRLADWEKNETFKKNYDAYTNGVNAFIETLAEASIPLEYKLLSFKPRSWSNLYSVATTLSMAEMLCSSEMDLENTNTKLVLGEKIYDDLFPLYNPQQKSIIEKENEWNFNAEKPKAKKDSLNFGKLIFHEKPEEGIGSNNWVIAPEKTKNGNAILANDPHLPLSLPSIWFEVHIHTPETNVYGVSIPGLPGVIIGFNENIAWGVTNVGRDVLDWYKIKWTDENKEAYWLDDKKVNVEKRIENILVKGSPIVTDTVKFTHFGPIAYSSSDGDMSMKWVVHQSFNDQESLGFIKLNHAESMEDFFESTDKYSYPAQNIVFADVKGNIALNVAGTFPLLRKEQGRFIQDGSETKNDWLGYIPKHQNPKQRNPEKGFLSSANQRSADLSYPHYYHGNFDDYRGRLLDSLLSLGENLDFDQMQNLQLSNYSIHAKEGINLLKENIELADLSPEEEMIFNALKHWNCEFDAGSIEATYFSIWWDHLYSLLWDEFKEHKDVIKPQMWSTIAILNNQSKHPYIDLQSTTIKEEAADVILMAFKSMCAELEHKDKDELLWSKYKGSEIRHLARIPAFSRSIAQTGGYRQALNAMSKYHGPSWRMIVEMEEKNIKAKVIYPGGQSGNPGSKYYDNFVEDWAEGKYYDVGLSKEESQVKSIYSIILNRGK